MSKKKWIAVIAVVGIALWFVVGFFSGRGGSSGKTEASLPKPPAAAFEIVQGNLQYYTDSYQSQGRSVVLTDFYAMVDGKWKHVVAKIPTILSERNGEIKIRRLQN